MRGKEAKRNRTKNKEGSIRLKKGDD